MASELKAVKLVNGSLHESPLRGGTIILRGVIEAGSLKNLLVDDYQREALPLARLSKLLEALKGGNTLPDIEIGMRGEKVKSSGDTWTLNDECFIIDGQQRVNACRSYLEMNPGQEVFIGAAIHFDTDKEWERERFRILNSDRVKVSPNVLVRNMRETSMAVQKIYEMTNFSDSVFCLGGRVSWDQNMKRGKLVTALNMLKIVGMLHGHIAPANTSAITTLVPNLDRLAARITPEMMMLNIKTFYDVVDEVWGVRAVQYRELSPHLSGGFGFMLARVFSNHLDFWRGPNKHKLYVDSDVRKKMASFPIKDPGILPLTSSAGASRHVLMVMFVKHLNSGKRTNRLTPRIEAYDDDEGITDEGSE